MRNTKRGFTLIELLVVIAIIGILSAIVLASLSTARNKAQDSKVQGQLSSARAAAEIYYGNNGGVYGVTANCGGGMFIDNTSGMWGLVNGLTGVVCNSSNTAWAIKANLVSTPTNVWCVDSSGASKNVGTNITSATVCP